jgi:hypothetical protein
MVVPVKEEMEESPLLLHSSVAHMGIAGHPREDS